MRRLLVTTGAACLLAAALPALTVSAAVEPGSGLSSFALAANAPAVQVRQVDGSQCGGEPAATGGCEGVVPEAVSTLRNGPVGYALSSVVWPGTLAGNLGSLLILAGGEQVPEDARALNTPIRAEARSGGDGKPVVNDDTPGARMVAQATDTSAAAEATLTETTTLPGATTGASSGRTTVSVTGARTAVAEARSTVKDLTVAGVVTIASVTSQARATTDGTTADASGSTVTSGVEIAGVPVTIDERGVTVAGQGAPANSIATALVNTAISNAGMTIAVSQPDRVVEGGTVSYTSGSLVFVWEQQPGVATTVILGGTRVMASATPAFAFGGGTGGSTGTGGAATGGGTTGGPAFAPPLEGVTAPPPLTDPSTGPVAPGVPPPATAPVALAPLLSGRRAPLPGGLSPGVVALGLVGAALVAAGLRRLPDRVLDAPATTCPLEETP